MNAIPSFTVNWFIYVITLGAVAKYYNALQTGEPQFKITNLTDNTGLYIEELASMRLYHKEWKLVTYVNMTEYQQEYLYLRDTIKKVSDKCERVRYDLTLYPDCDTCKNGLWCDSILQHLNAFMGDLEENNAKWWVQVDAKERSKRGLINIVGLISKQLFGTLSQDDAEQYLARFEKIKSENKERDEILHAQTSLIEASIEFANSSLLEQREANRIIDQKFLIISKQLDKQKKETDRYFTVNRVHMGEIRDSIQDIAFEILINLVRFAARQRKFLDAISVGHRSPNSPVLIAPATFVKELHNIRNAIAAEDLDLPLPITIENLAQYYHISTPEVRLISNQMIISGMVTTS